MRKFLRRSVIASTFAVLLGIVGMAAAQDACAALVQAAYSATALECADVTPGQICYGNRPLDVAALGSGLFTRPGHRVTGVQKLDSGAMNTESGEWGVALLDVQANTPDQTVTMIVLGDVTLEDASGASSPVILAPVRVAESTGLNVREAPAEDADVVGLLNFGEIVSATGRLEHVEWLRVALPDGESGWVSALSVLPEGDVDALPVVTAADDSPASLFSPLQAFDFRSGAEAAPCRAAPESGLLLQTSQSVNMRVNGVDVQFDGTLFLQAPRELAVNVLEGSVQITSGGRSESASAGDRIRVRYDSEAQALGTPRPPEPYAYVELLPLPLSLLPREIEEMPFNLVGVATPASPGRPLLDGIIAESDCTVAAVNEVRLRQGPGVDYPIQAALYAGESARPDGRAAGDDGVLWWRLAEGVWVRSDVVLAAGTCGALPLVEAPPLPTATP